jgi:hypothetical protein
MMIIKTVLLNEYKKYMIFLYNFIFAALYASHSKKSLSTYFTQLTHIFKNSIQSNLRMIRYFCAHRYLMNKRKKGVTQTSLRIVMTQGEEKNIVGGNAMLESIPDHCIGLDTRLKLCHGEAIAANKVGNPVAKDEDKKHRMDTKRKVTITGEEEVAWNPNKKNKGNTNDG